MIDKALDVIGAILGIIFLILLWIGLPGGVIWVLCCAVKAPIVEERTECTPHETKPGTIVCEKKKEYIYPPDGYQFYTGDK